MHNNNYEYASSAKGSNFFYPLGWQEFLPFYANTQTPDFELLDFPITTQAPPPAMSAEMIFERWSAITDNYTEAGALSATAGFGGFLRSDYSSSFALAVEEPEDETITASFASSASNAASFTPVTFSATFFSVRMDTNTDVRDNTHQFETITEYDKQYFTIQSSSSKRLTNSFSSTSKDFVNIFPTAHNINLLTVNTAGIGTVAGVNFLVRTYANRHFRMLYVLPKRARPMATVEWLDFDDVAITNTEQTLTSPVLRFNRTPVRVDYAVTSAGTAIVNYPGSPLLSLTLSTLRENGDEETTFSTISNLSRTEISYIGNTTPVLNFTTFWTSVSSKHIGRLSNGDITILDLAVPMASYGNFGSFNEVIPGLSSQTVSTVGGSRTITHALNGYAVQTFPESVYQQQVLIHSHFGAYGIKYVPKAGYAPLLVSFTGTSPIYLRLNTTLSKTLSGLSFKGYFPYAASIIPNVFQLVTNSNGSHEIIVHVTESSTYQSSTSQETVSTVPTISISNGNMNTIVTTQNTSKTVFSVINPFLTTYLDTVYYITSNLSSNSGLFTLRRIDFKSSTRSLVMQLLLDNPVNGTERVELAAGGGIAAFFKQNTGFYGGVDAGLNLLGITKETTAMFNWGNWVGTRYSFNTANLALEEVNRTTFRILRGEQSIFQTSSKLKSGEFFYFSHKEQFRLEILNASYTDYATVNYPLIENQSRFERYQTSSPLYPARHLDTTNSYAGVSEI
jgi:hypothetical protein